jgi:hypothetical protein
VIYADARRRGRSPRHSARCPLFGPYGLTDTAAMPPSACTFERAWEHVTVTRHQADGSVQVVIKWSDGLTCSCAFVSLNEALEYQRQFESALSAAGWVREGRITARPPHANTRS